MVNQSNLVENLNISIWQSDSSLSFTSNLAPRLVKFKNWWFRHHIVWEI